eukprot:scaffold2963_cov112-Isochrysis_galbana.AAC.1
MEIDEEIETDEAEAKATAGVGLERRPRAPALPRTPREAPTPPTDEPSGKEEWANLTPTHLSRERDREVESGADMPSGATAGKRACEDVEHGAAPEPPFTPEDPGEKVRRACGRGGNKAAAPRHESSLQTGAHRPCASLASSRRRMRRTRRPG